MSRIVSVDQVKLRRMVERHHSSAYNWAVFCCNGDRENAADVLQTVYVRILEKENPFGGRSSFKTWLFAVIKKTAQKSHYRLLARTAKQKILSLTSTVPNLVDDEIHREEVRQRLLTMLSRLSRRQHEVLMLVFYHELTIEEAAKVMQISLGSARTHYARGKSRLRQLIEESELKEDHHAKRYGNQKAV